MKRTRTGEKELLNAETGIYHARNTPWRVTNG